MHICLRPGVWLGPVYVCIYKDSVEIHSKVTLHLPLSYTVHYIILTLLHMLDWVNGLALHMLVYRIVFGIHSMELYHLPLNYTVITSYHPCMCFGPGAKLGPAYACIKGRDIYSLRNFHWSWCILHLINKYAFSWIWSNRAKAWININSKNGFEAGRNTSLFTVSKMHTNLHLINYVCFESGGTRPTCNSAYA